MIAAALRRLGRPATHAELASSAGHDAFLVDDALQAPLIEEFLGAL
jgi:homoserine acetyltransferase